MTGENFHIVGRTDGVLRQATGAALAALLLASSLRPSPARADGCVLDSWDNGTVAAVPYLWPNWTKTWVASYDFMLCDGCGYASETITNITIANFGTASSADIKGVYAIASCDGGKTSSGTLTMSFAGTYTSESGAWPAWTWAGATPSFAGCPSIWGGGGVQSFTIDIYIDIDDCPTDQATVNMGFPVNWINNPSWPGSVRDNNGCISPWYDMGTAKDSIIEYVMKYGPNFAAPGDTVQYTVFYGRPGTNAYTNIIVTDSQPAYTHYVPGSATPAPDTFWDPNPGPPMKLRWTLAGGSPTGGRTSELTFALTVDWGNGESFEAGSGNVAAPEGSRLRNTAHVDWRGSNCTLSVVSQEVRTVIRRFLFWQIGDNDILFAGKIGMPDDEMTYSIFIKNYSSEKTWWNVSVWDTVPAELDVWTPGYGVDDQCVGWTMTPTGCAPAGAGRVLSGANTILTWRLDIPPLMTLELRWKARVKPSVNAGSAALSRASILPYGRSRIINGTGHAGQPRYFTHQAAIVLRTTYVAYGAYASACDDSTVAAGQAYHIHFFPLNKMTNFELRKQEHCDGVDVWAANGGVSPTIATYAGTCVGGFPDGGWPGCKIERVPASYWPSAYIDVFPPFPCHNVYKVTSNSPFIWEEMSNMEDGSADRWAWVGATSLTYAGYMHYSFMQVTYLGRPPGDNFFVINTEMDTATSSLLFKWNTATLQWDFMDLAELDPGAIWLCDTAPRFNTAPDNLGDSYRLLSSDTVCLAYRYAWNQNSNRGIMAPVAETGLLVSKGTLPQRFFAMLGPDGYNGSDAQAAVMNIGAVNANYEVSRYNRNGFYYNQVPSGNWTTIAYDSVPSGFNTGAGWTTWNPHIYGRIYDGGKCRGPFTATGSNLITDCWFYMFDVKTAGSALEVLSGWDASSSFSGGSILHDSAGSAFGTDFWYPQVCPAYQCKSGVAAIETVDIFCSSTGMVVKGFSNDGYTATYTTTGPDQVVSFRKMTDLPTNTTARRNWRFQLSGTSGMASAQYIYSEISEKYYALPFVSTGVYYNIIAPPVVYAGQTFWITVIAINVGGGTKTDYSGTSSFSSTDPAAKIEGKAMDGYNYAWNGCGSNCGVKMFINVSFLALGLQTLVATDTMDGSIVGLTTIMVVGADVKLEKRKRLTVAASGDTVQFELCWQNISSATAFSFMITDAVPMGTTYVPEIASTMLCWSSSPAPGLTVWYSTATTTTPPGTFTSVPGTSSPLSNTRWLRWTIRDAYVNSSGCVCFKVSVN